MPRYEILRKRRMMGGRKTAAQRAARRAKILKSLKAINRFLKRTKAISKVSGLASQYNVPYAGMINQHSKRLGYGKKRKVIRSRIVRRPRKTVSRTISRGYGINLAGSRRGYGLHL